MVLIAILLFFPALINANASNFNKNNLEELTNIFFDNLRALPFLLTDGQLDEGSKEFIQKQIENYKILNYPYEENNNRLKKRSLNNDLFNFTVELSPILNIPGKNSVHTILVTHKTHIYAIVLENEGNQLSIFEYNNLTFTKKITRSVTKGLKVDAFALESSLLIVVAEFRNTSNDIENKAKIFEWDFENDLKVRQSIDVSYGTDVKIWKHQDDIFMSIANYKNSEDEYETKTPIYKWLDSYFDIIQYVETSGARSITPIWIEELHLLAISNSKRNSGNVNTYSEILMFDSHSETFISYQRILTRGCHDIKYFGSKQFDEHFLVVANTYNKENDGSLDYETNSIIYKLVDDYFIPFQTIPTNGIVQWESGVDLHNNFILFGLNIFGHISSYHYDGWRFIQQNLNGIPSNKEIKSIGTYVIDNKHVLVISNSTNNTQLKNVYEVKVQRSNELEKKYKDMLKWCQSNVEKFEDKSSHSVSKRQIDENLDNINFGEMEIMHHTIDSYKLQIQQVEKKVKQSYQINGTHVIEKDLSAENILLIGDAKFNNLDTKFLNEDNIENLKDNIFNIHEAIEVTTPIQFDRVSVNSAHMQFLNRHSVDDILHKYDELHLKKLDINGIAEVSNGITVTGLVNNMNITDKNILLRTGDQQFADFHQGTIEVDNLHTKFLNKLNMETLNMIHQDAHIKKLDNLTVKNLVIGGFINDVDIPTLYKYALRKSGAQEISNSYFFDSIEANDMTIEGLLSDSDISNLVYTTHGMYDLNKNVRLTHDLDVHNLFVRKFLNNIQVKKGKLDILLKESNVTQYISGNKEFENVDILNLIRLQGRINNKELQEKNVLATVNQPLVLNDDITISGDVLIEELLNCKDIVSNELSHSLKHVDQQGLRLEDTEVPIHLRLDHPLNTGEIFIDKINNVDPNSWVINGVNQTQIIHGWKHIFGDVKVTGGTSADKVNNINVSDLESNVLMKNGNQTISGKHVVKYIATEHDIIYDNISFGTNRWEDVVTTYSDQKITGKTTFVKNLKLNTGNVSSLEVKGRINEYNFNEILQDIVAKNASKKIKGNKKFLNLTAENLNIKSAGEVESMMKLIKNGGNVFQLNRNVDIPSDLDIENVYFEETFNGVPKDRFDGKSVVENDEYHVKEKREFDTVTIYNKAYIESKKINDVDLKYIVEDSVKKDEPFDFHNVVFTKPIYFTSALNLDGHIEHLDLENIINSKSEGIQVLEDQKWFSGHFIVNGNVYLNGKLNGNDVNKMCSMIAQETPLNLNIQGNAIFAKGPTVSKINEYLVDDISKNTWFTDRPITIDAQAVFDNVTFNNKVSLKGYMNGENLNNIASNYFSKSKNQTVFSTLVFTNDVVFLSSITTPELNISGSLNDINLQELMQTVLLNETDQVFESPVFFDNFITEEIHGEYLVNQLDLESNVMRYDVDNVVTGTKIFTDLSVNNLLFKDHIKIQDVALSQWLKSVLMNQGSHQVTGTYKFTAPPTFSKGISLEGTLNGKNFTKNNIMLKDAIQNITGLKTFIVHPQDPIRFKSIKMKKGTINDVHFSDMVNNEAYLNRDSVFETPLNFYNNLTVENININKHFNGVNVSELLRNISSLSALNNFDDNYTGLKLMSQQIRTSLESQAYFLEYYKVVMTLLKTNFVAGIALEDGSEIMLTFSNRSNNFDISAFVWDAVGEYLIHKDTFTVGLYPNCIKKVNLGSNQYIYIERNINKEEHIDSHHSGELLQIKPNHTIAVVYNFLTNGSHFVSSFYFSLRKEHCMSFIDKSENNILILCENKGKLYYLSTLRFKSAHALSFLDIHNETYMAVISHGNPERSSCTEILKFNHNSSMFESQQIIYEEKPTSISSIEYNGHHYLAIVSGHLENTMLFGVVTLRRFNQTSGQFEIWQVLRLHSPLQVEFSILPSNELVLYVLTDNPTEPFIVYMYSGVSGLVESIVGSTIPKSNHMCTFTLRNNVFVAAFHNDEINIMKGMFKGNKI